MFSKKSNKVKKVRLKTDSYRIQAQVLFLPTTRLLWLNTYMPVDPQTISYGSDDLKPNETDGAQEIEENMKQMEAKRSKELTPLQFL